MAAPTVQNRRPDDGDTEVLVSEAFRFGIRDEDTRADLSTLYSSATYARLNYVPDADLPADDGGLEAATSLYLSTFNDAAGQTDPEDPCDQTVTTVSGSTVYQIEQTAADGEVQEGVLYLSETIDHPRPVMVRAKLDLAFVTAYPSPPDYIAFSGFVGTILGLAYWPENTGVFLFFVDDGTKKVVLAGPSEDGSGTRSGSVTTVFDWSAEAYTYTILFDPSAQRRKVTFFATDSTGEETLLGDLDLDSLPQFLDSVRMGFTYAEDPPADQATMVLGGDFYGQNNYIDIYSFKFAGHGQLMTSAGLPTPQVSLTRETNETTFVDGALEDAMSEWRPQGTWDEVETGVATRLDADGSEAYYFRDEPDLAGKSWMVMGYLAGDVAVHPGSYETGMGLKIEDGSAAFELLFLDSFVDQFVGITDSDAADDTTVTGYHIPTGGPDWGDGFRFTMLGSESKDILRLYLESDEVEPAIDATYTAAGLPSATDTRISLGMLEALPSWSGRFFILNLWFLPNCTFYEAKDGTYPDSQGWLRAASGGSRSIASSLMTIDCTAAGAYDIYYIEDATYLEDSGGCIELYVEVEDWTDAAGTTNPLRAEFGPIAAVRTNDAVAQVYSQLFFTRGSDGRGFIYLSDATDDFEDVLAQNSVGKQISAEIDLSTPHTILLDVKPYQYIRVYIDRSAEPDIEIAWQDADIGIRQAPSNLPASAVIAFGSLGEGAGVKAVFGHARGGVGKGYDLKLVPQHSDEVLAGDKVYGASTDLFTDFEDED